MEGRGSVCVCEAAGERELYLAAELCRGLSSSRDCVGGDGDALYY